MEAEWSFSVPAAPRNSWWGVAITRLNAWLASYPKEIDRERVREHALSIIKTYAGIEGNPMPALNLAGNSETLEFTATVAE